MVGRREATGENLQAGYEDLAPELDWLYRDAAISAASVSGNAAGNGTSATA